MNDKPATGFAQDIDAMTLARAQRGDMAAFAQLYQRYARACFLLALRLTGQRQPAEDLVHEAFLKMMDTIGSYRGEAPFGAWFKRLTANTAIDWLRRQRHPATNDADTLLEHAVGPDSDSASLVDADSLLARLPPRARAIVVLHELEGYTHAELAALFGQSESYSKSILARALKRLQALATPAAHASKVAL
ncbi:MAG: RNA polymerase sigma factor [Proteobacteria bacterium]|nr:RNA polymerase sigma factor [Pseudomonadota bacterium]